jgi:hypothetical protein
MKRKKGKIDRKAFQAKETTARPKRKSLFIGGHRGGTAVNGT